MNIPSDPVLLIVAVILMVAAVVLFFRSKQHRRDNRTVLSAARAMQSTLEPTASHTQLVVGESAERPAIRFSPIESLSDYHNAKPYAESGKTLSRLGALMQAAPSLAVATEVSGKRLMEVTINGELVRAADGNGLRAFAMGERGITEHARLFDAKNLGNLVNAAAIWQIASVVVAQKHLADISRKLDELKGGIDKISSFLGSQRKSRVISTFEYLRQVETAIRLGELPHSARIELESCERDLLEIQNHLSSEYQDLARQGVRSDEKFGTEVLTRNIAKRLTELDEKAAELALCVQARIAAWYVLALYPGEPELKAARRVSIQRSVDELGQFGLRVDKFMREEIGRVDAVFNTQKTLRKRRSNLLTQSHQNSDLSKARFEESQKEIERSTDLLGHSNGTTRLFIELDSLGAIVSARSVESAAEDDA
jgi:hypothetical protein